MRYQAEDCSTLPNWQPPVDPTPCNATIPELLAAIELEKRLFMGPLIQNGPIDAPEKAAEAMSYHLAFQAVEKVCVRVLDIKRRY